MKNYVKYKFLALTKQPFSLLVCLGLLILTNLLMIFSTSAVTGLQSFDDSYYFIRRNMIFLSIGIVVFFIGYFISISFIRKYTLFIVLFALFLLLLCLSPLGVTIGGASRWLNLVVIRFQPVEFVKLSLILFCANYLDLKKHKLSNFFSGTFPLVCVFSLVCLLLLLQPDLGNTALILLFFLSILFLSPLPISHFLLLIFSALSLLITSIILNPYQRDRVLTFLSPDLDPFGKGYHISQSLLSIGSGGAWGLGLGQSKLKFFYLPLQYSDFIFSIIGEEGGFLFSSFIVLIFLFIAIKSIGFAVKASSTFNAYCILGLMLFLVFQAFINISAVLALIPVTGIPLTFISFGGTSLISSLFSFGLLLNLISLDKKHD